MPCCLRSILSKRFSNITFGYRNLLQLGLRPGSMIQILRCDWLWPLGQYVASEQSLMRCGRSKVVRRRLCSCHQRWEPGWLPGWLLCCLSGIVRCILQGNGGLYAVLIKLARSRYLDVALEFFFLCLRTEKLDIQPSCCHGWSIIHLFAGRTYIFSSGGGTSEKKSGEERVQETLFLLENIAQTCLAPRILACLLTTTISHRGELENSSISEFKRFALATALWKLG